MTDFTPCGLCPLRPLKYFRDFTPDELKFVEGFKTAEVVVDRAKTVLLEGAPSSHLYTVLSGWAFRYKMLEDGRRQILNYVLPGDLLGLQGTLMGQMQHSIEAMTPLRLCVFDKNRLIQLFNNHPELALDITWIASREECILDEHLLSIGRRSALERAAYLIAFLHKKARVVTPPDGPVLLPLTQQHLADTLGLSIVHTNKTLRKLQERGFILWQARGCEVIDPRGLAALAGWNEGEQRARPFI